VCGYIPFAGFSDFVKAVSISDCPYVVQRSNILLGVFPNSEIRSTARLLQIGRSSDFDVGGQRIAIQHLSVQPARSKQLLGVGSITESGNMEHIPMFCCPAKLRV
jgi:hypothetical protein